MEELYKECKTIYHIRYTIGRDTHAATAKVLERLQEETNGLTVLDIPDTKIRGEFVLHGEHAIYTRPVNYATKQSRKDKFDRKQIGAPINTATRAIKRFFKFNEEKYKNYIIGLNLGNEGHDMAVFVKKNKFTYELIHFNPNGGERSKRMEEFAKQMSIYAIRKGYKPERDNDEGACSFMAWKELLKFLLLGENPFTRQNLLDYSISDRTYLSKIELEKRTEERRQYANRLFRNKRRQVIAKERIQGIKSSDRGHLMIRRLI